MSSMNLWKVWPAFFNPKGILRNSHSPKGVMTAILGTSVAATGICQYPFLRSMVENTFIPSSLVVRSSMCGGRYRSYIYYYNSSVTIYIFTRYYIYWQLVF